MASRNRCWLFKTEPESYSIDDLANEPGRVGRWDGVRNYQARNLLRDEIAVGDHVLLYHSSTEERGVVGTARIVRAAYPDPTQFDRRSPYHDPKSKVEAPRWVAVDLELETAFARTVTLAEMRREPELADMPLLARGQRLSILAVTPAHWRRIVEMSKHEPDDE